MPAIEVQLEEIYVLPGESHLVRVPTLLRTVLGSCVGVCFRVPRLGLGGLCHPMLPRYPVKQPALMNPVPSRRYVDFAIRDMARQLDAIGVTRTETEIKLFGGGDVLLVADINRPTVGQLNCERALEVLDEEGYRISASSLGGNRGINIHFNSHSGEVLLRRHS